MKKNLMGAALAWALVSLAGAAVLQDWTVMNPGKTAGVFTDKEGSTVKMEKAQGPEGEEALKITCNLVSWGGAWTLAEGDLTGMSAVSFKAKTLTPGLIMVGLTDDQKTQYVTKVKVTSADWTDFIIPLSLFKKTPWPMPDAPKDAKIRWNKIVSLVIQPQAHGTSSYLIGPVSSIKGKVEASTGIAPAGKTLVVQDFTMLEKSSYGTFADDKKGTFAKLAVKNDPDADGKKVLGYNYSFKVGGWCGGWFRAGDSWDGQDWTGAKQVVIKVKSDEPIALQFGFNDANQNAYFGAVPSTRGSGWETVTLDFKDIVLNPYYQPTDAKKGAKQDLSRIETFNLAPITPGSHGFEVGEITIEK